MARSRPHLGCWRDDVLVLVLVQTAVCLPYGSNISAFFSPARQTGIFFCFVYTHTWELEVDGLQRVSSHSLAPAQSMAAATAAACHPSPLEGGRLHTLPYAPQRAYIRRLYGTHTARVNIGSPPAAVPWRSLITSVFSFPTREIFSSFVIFVSSTWYFGSPIYMLFFGNGLPRPTNGLRQRSPPLLVYKLA